LGIRELALKKELERSMWMVTDGCYALPVKLLPTYGLSKQDKASTTMDAPEKSSGKMVRRNSISSITDAVHSYSRRSTRSLEALNISQKVADEDGKAAVGKKKMRLFSRRGSM
jgi:hypothetical protein